ncbi:MAG TPA: hypothetical protein VIL65_04210 [Beijerinckiaceae bacterium]|jgi:hypothetical protein
MSQQALARFVTDAATWRGESEKYESSFGSRQELVELNAGDMPAISSYLCGLSVEGRRRRFHAGVDDHSIRTFCSAVRPEAFGAVAQTVRGVIVGLAELHADPTGLRCEIALSSSGEEPARMGDLLGAALALARRRGARWVEYVWFPGEDWAPAAFRALGGRLDHPARRISLDLTRNDPEPRRPSAVRR